MLHIPFQSFFTGIFLKGLMMAFDLKTPGNKITPAFIKEELIKYDVVPTQIPVAPNYAIAVEYTSGVVNFGTNFTERQVLEAPIKMSWPVEKKMQRSKAFFTMLMYGPDVPTRADPLTKYQWQHWLIVNIPGNKWKSGQVVTEYRAWQPFYTNDIHRCLFIVYPQKGGKRIQYNDAVVHVNSTDETRGFFNKDNFAKKYGLGPPYAINFFQMYLNGSEDGNIWR